MKMKINLLNSLLTMLLVCQTSLGNQYVDAGVPATDREWHGHDYMATLKLIASKSISLPTYSNDDGRKVIARLVNRENFSLNKNRSIPIQQRLQDFVQLSQGANTIMKVYAQEVYSNNRLKDETSAILAFSLYLAEVGVDLMNEFIPTVPKDDKYEIRMQGIKQMFSGITTQFSGAEVTLTERDILSDKNRALILSAMHKTAPTLKVAFSKEFKAEMKLKLEKHKEYFGETEIILIDELIKELEAEPVTSPNSVPLRSTE